MHIEQNGISLENQSLDLDTNPYSLFVGSIRSPVTREKYRIKGCPEISADIARLVTSINSTRKSAPKLIEEIIA